MTNNEKKSKTTISDLPDCCLREIFLNIPIAGFGEQVRVSFRTVCKRWAAVIDDCWRETRDLVLCNMPDQCCPFNHVDKRMMELMSAILSSTTIFDISNERLIVATRKPKTVEGFMNHCGPYLIALNEQRNDDVGFGKTTRPRTSPIMSLAAEKCHKLEKFSGYVQSKEDGKKLRDLLVTCKKLMSLEINIQIGNVYTFFQRIPTHQLENLKILINRITDQRLPKYIKATIRNCQVLKKLQTDYMDNELVELIPNLNELHLGSAGSNKLVIYNPSILIKDEHLISLSKTCLQLTSVTINQCPYVTDAGVSALSSLPKLKALYLLELMGFDGTCLKYFSTLDELDVTKCYKIKDADVIGLLKNSQILRSLKLNRCENITNKTLTVAVQETTKRNNNIVLMISCQGTKAKPEEVRNTSTLLKFN